MLKACRSERRAERPSVKTHGMKPSSTRLKAHSIIRCPGSSNPADFPLPDHGLTTEEYRGHLTPWPFVRVLPRQMTTDRITENLPPRQPIHNPECTILTPPSEVHEISNCPEFPTQTKDLRSRIGTESTRRRLLREASIFSPQLSRHLLRLVQPHLGIYPRRACVTVAEHCPADIQAHGVAGKRGKN